MSIAEAAIFFENFSKVSRILKALVDVGLGYLSLGQPSHTLSGGEAQRIKLATELSRVSTGKTLYVLDEPTTGLHIADVRRLVSVLQNLVDMGNTVIVIEHHMDLIKVCDWIIDLGPEGGEAGGHLVGAGTPESIAANAKSLTGKYLEV
jgi:excinuclease ABC subunit A